jgi:hypothetical protein
MYLAYSLPYSSEKISVVRGVKSIEMTSLIWHDAMDKRHYQFEGIGFTRTIIDEVDLIDHIVGYRSV